MLSFSKHLTYLYVCVNYTAGNGGCQERKEAVLKRQPLFEFVGGRPWATRQVFV